MRLYLQDPENVSMQYVARTTSQVTSEMVDSEVYFIIGGNPNPAGTELYF